ncbi:metallophosphoesterase [Hymenobacter sp. BT175]|uniref:metallophosphoesterase n=1 Tax=Hymenobacter translucens TaxID=2886507 RepID=UPI001D0F2FA5|nr:metallophosphoesterase [Hymenobacter translucens]MCC2544928.1 metallophosphoesterase [Hymenobacter translucens]
MLSSVTASTLFLYALGIFGLALVIWLVLQFLKERRFRRLAYVAPGVRHWANEQPDPSTLLKHRVAMVGDLGAVSTDGRDPVLGLLKNWLQESGAEATVVVLGDNVYPVGLPAEQSPGRATAERRLQAQLDLLRAYPARAIFLSGNHDWNKGRRNGYEFLLRQEAYVREQLPTAHYLPPGGYPGPVSVQLAEGLLLVVLNTQWWVQNGPRPYGQAADGTPADAKTPFRELHTLLAANSHQQILIAGHHPLYSNAVHGGKFTAKQHVFPLTAVHKKAYVPLPLLGSLFPVYRMLLGAAEDMAHPPYRQMRRCLLRVLRQFPGIIYAAGHDHNLQYFQRRGGHYLVSGAGSKTSFVQAGGRATFVHEHKGFFSLDYYENGEVWLRALEPGTDLSQPPREAFRWRLTSARSASRAQDGVAAASARAGSVD